MTRSLFRISFYKITAFFGGRNALILVCILILCCLTVTALIANTSTPDTVEAVIVDLCDGPYSRAFCFNFAAADGIHAEIIHTVSEGEDRILYDSAEVMLILSGDYDRLISEPETLQTASSDHNGPLISFKTAPGSESAELLRETAAGLMLAQRSEIRVRNSLEADGFDVSEFEKYMTEATQPNLYSVSFSEKSPSENRSHGGLVRAGFNGVAALLLVLTLLTLTRRMADPTSVLVTQRIEILHNGRLFAFISDYLALFLVALFLAAVSFGLSPTKSTLSLFGWICYSLCISAISLLISGFGSFGRIDILAPFLAIVTSVLGGCFTDLSLLSDAFVVIARCVPQGQLFAVINGNGLFCIVLFAESVLVLLTAYLVCRNKTTLKAL